MINIQQWWQEIFGAHEPWAHAFIAFTTFLVICSVLVWSQKGKILGIQERRLQKRFLLLMALISIFFGLGAYLSMGPRS